MAVSPSDLAELAQTATMVPDHELPDLSALETNAEVLAFVVASVRASGTTDEADAVELVIRYAKLSPDSVRAAERVLRRLGYTRVCDRMRQIAGRRKHALGSLSGPKMKTGEAKALSG